MDADVGGWVIREGIARVSYIDVRCGLMWTC